MLGLQGEQSRTFLSQEPPKPGSMESSFKRNTQVSFISPLLLEENSSNRAYLKSALLFFFFLEFMNEFYN